MATISAVVCVDANMGIGYDGKLLYRSPVDMAFFCGLTQGKLVVGGRQTMEGIKPLPNRGMVCLTRNNKNVEDISKYVAVTSLDKFDEIVELAEYLDTDIVIIGGEQIYAKLADRVDELYLTVLNVSDDELKEADAFFPTSCYNHLGVREVVFTGENMRIYHCTKS